MPLAGSDSLLEKTMTAAIFAGLQAEFASDVAPSGSFAATLSQQHMKMAKAIAKAATPIVLHIVANAQVAPGIPVATAGGPAAQTGASVGPGVLL